MIPNALLFFLIPVKNKSSKKIITMGKLAVLLSVLPNASLSQEDFVVFHNVENLFYPTDDPKTFDDDFTSKGIKHWTFSRYNDKLNKLSKLYASIDSKIMPSLIGLAEVENDTVLDALCNTVIMRKTGYKFIHYQSNDPRGIDVALLYNPKRFEVLESYPISFDSLNSIYQTRDVLFVRGRLNKVELCVYVVHAPSRRDNDAKKQLRQRIFQEVFLHIKRQLSEGHDNILVMGDMNDNPWDETIKQGFSIRQGDTTANVLTNLMLNNKGKVGSYVFGGKYHCFDQFMVSKNLKNRIIIRDNFNSSFIYMPDFMIEKSKNGKLTTPLSTYKGMSYKGGFSDHFPIILKLSSK